MRKATFASLAACTLLGVTRRADAKDVDATDVTESGLHAAITTTHGGDKSGRVGYVGLSSSHVGFGYEKPATLRVINTGAIAFGEHGLEGGIGNAVAGGVRAPFGKNHGLVVRGGGELTLFGNRYLWYSVFEIPQLQLGYQWLVPNRVADVALKGGYVLLGRHNTGDSGVRDLAGSPEWGAIGSLHLGPIDLRASFTRIHPRHGGSPVDVLEGAFCGNPLPLTVCTDVRYEAGDVRVPDGALRGSSVAYLGMTVGYLFEKKKKKN
jgi:hypothetical protein